MHLVVTVPALNEEETIGSVVRSIPRQIDGFDRVEVLVLNDGSVDQTVSEAWRAGCDRVVSFRQNQGLARVFRAGLTEAIAMGADVIVNIDGDGQYEASQMTALLRPVLEGEADIVLGSRFAGFIEEMPRSKWIGNRFGTWVTSKLSGVPLTDAQTGYRAFTRHAALTLNVLSGFTYTQETIIQAGYKRLRVVEVPVTFYRRVGGPSRLVRSFIHYGRQAAVTVARLFGSHHALGLLMGAGFLSLLFGLALGGYVIAHFIVTGQVSPHLPSAILAGFGVLFGVHLMALGVLAAIITDNKALTEDALYLLKDQRSPRAIANGSLTNAQRDGATDGEQDVPLQRSA